jgi:hypothetical protein
MLSSIRWAGRPHRLINWLSSVKLFHDGKGLSVTLPLHKTEQTNDKAVVKEQIHHSETNPPLPKEEVRQISLPTKQTVYITEPPTTAKVEELGQAIPDPIAQPPFDANAIAKTLAALPASKPPKPAAPPKEVPLTKLVVPDKSVVTPTPSPYVPPSTRQELPHMQPLNPHEAEVLQWCEKYNKNTAAVARCIKAELARPDEPPPQQPQRYYRPQFRFPFFMQGIR